ncbi:MAG: hypothetical protein JXR25_02840 [Pontiellaceae bacterium]|nr:hypothetical protein [Pontiellaceae bacterium]MBN2783740.1 hypothetical protein [Pontiellaceae bacterium]
MSKVYFSAVLAGLLLTGISTQADPIAAKITIGNKTSDGYIVMRKDDLITFRQIGMSSGAISYPVDAIKEIYFPIKVNGDSIKQMQENRMYEELAATLELALKPYMEYSDLPTNLAQYQGVLMELYYKVQDYEKTMLYASGLVKDDRNKELQRKAIVFQGLALLGAGRMDEAEALFGEQGWTEELPDDAPAEDLYITAKFLKMKQDYVKAIETASKIIAFHSQDSNWMIPAELLCAEIYMDMAKAKSNADFLDSATEVIREISLLYKDSDEASVAANLKLKVDAMREELED